jgi:hypothetical protein
VYATKGEIIFRDDLFNPDLVFKSPDWHLTTVSGGFDEDDQPKPDLTIWVLDRQIMGQDWLNPIAKPAPHPHRIVFYGLKGGVGRSTALAMVAYGLAREGKNVLCWTLTWSPPACRACCYRQTASPSLAWWTGLSKTPSGKVTRS